MTDVAFCRDIKPGARGKDVIAHKRAVSRAFPDLYPWQDFSGYYGRYFEKAVIKAKKRLELGSDDGIIREPFHTALEQHRAHNKPSEWAFDDYAKLLATEYCHTFTTQTVRDKIVEAGFYWYARRWKTKYSQNRPGEMCKPPQVASAWDCSLFFTNTHYAADAPDPNGYNYKGLMYTGSLLAGGKKVPLSKLRKGDAVMYGYTSSARPGFPVGSPTHVALYVGDGMVLSFGSYPMKYLPYDYRGINCYVSYEVN